MRIGKIQLKEIGQELKTKPTLAFCNDDFLIDETFNHLISYNIYK